MEGQLREKITRYIDDRARLGFKWGENDCALFANDMLVKFFGMPDAGEDFRYKYSNWKGAIKTCRELGYNSVVEIANTFGTVVDRPQVGDVALYFNGRALGVCMGVYSWFLGAKTSLIKIPTRQALQVWRYR